MRLLLVSTLVGHAAAAGCNGQSTPGPPNTHPVDETAPVLVKTVKNGVHYTVGPDKVDMIHVFGKPYDWGFAHGTMMKEKLLAFFPKVQTYLETQILPKAANSSLAALIAQVGIDAALDLSYDVTKKYTPAYVMQEIQGLADASGVSVAKVRRLMWMGELTRGACSMFGAWGDATASRGGKLLQLRALDWDVDGPFKDYPAVVVYHPSDASDGHAWANVGFIGWTASITGMSSAGLAISEIGVTYPDASFGKEHYLAPGYPFGFVLRDILQYDASLDDSIARITGAKRTCDLILGVGDGKNNAFRGFQYAPSVANVMNDTNLMPQPCEGNSSAACDDWHPRISEVVYWGMDWVCPNDNRMISHQLKALHGNITVANTIRDIVPYVQTGDLHIAVYDHDAMMMYVSVAAPTGTAGPVNAYQRQFFKLDLAKAFAEPPPEDLLVE